ncbi:DNA polymerase I [Candidatus Saganbacteria bacterium]|nr:DNA polymerase I [Candidatus Saganbacteria bacterium]
MPKIVLIDGNSLAYRAFYALPDTMRTSHGLITNAIYGFTTMLLKVLDEEPEAIAIAFDRPEPTFRHKKYDKYKGTRDKAPPSLYEQLPYVKKVAEAFAIPVFEQAGFEADDLIGTLAKKAEAKGYEVVIMTGDLDALQLVNDQIKVLAARKGLSETMLYGPLEVVERLGVKPEQVVDYKALRGDTSDNIPGVPKVGEKTAAQLLQDFGSLDNLLHNLDKVKQNGLRENLKNNIPLAELSRHLAQIVTNVPVEIDWQKLKREPTNWTKVIPLFEQLEFDRLIKKYTPGLDKEAVAAAVEKKREEISRFNFQMISTDKQLNDLISQLSPAAAFAFDVETTGLDPLTVSLVGLSFSVANQKAWYIPIGHNGTKEQLYKSKVLDKLQPLFLSDKLKIGHNIKYDIEVLQNQDLKISGPIFDTMVAAYLLDPTSNAYALKKLARQFLGRDMIKLDELIITDEAGTNFADVNPEVAADYACSDAEATFSLYEIFSLALKAQKLNQLATEVEMPLIEVLVAMESNGVKVDAQLLKQMSEEIYLALKDLETQIFAISGEVFNLNSPKQLANILFNKLMLPVIKKTKTGASTDSEVLEELAAQKFEIAEKLQDYRQLAKLKSTYFDVLPTLVNPKSGRIHTSFNQTITATGRLSSSNPNLQNIPIKSSWGKRLRQAFIPEEKGWQIVAADYSQIELRILAHLSRDTNLVAAFNEDKDVHTSTAAHVYGITEEQVTKEMRSAAKAINFGIIYGISDFGLAKQLKIKKTEAAQFIENYFKQYPGVKEFIDSTIKQAKEKGYVTTMLGRKRPMPDINSPNQGLRSFAERTAINTVVQGTAADMIKVAMVRINLQLQTSNLKTKTLLQVHDELIFEAPENEVGSLKKIIETEMIGALKLSVPIKVDISVGKNWAEAG